MTGGIGLDLLAAAVGPLTPAGPHTWTFGLGDAVRGAGRADLADGWLALTRDGARLDGGADPFAVFAKNATLAAGLRCVLAHHGRGLAYRADVALDPETDVAGRLAAVAAALATPATASDASIAPRPVSPALERRCRDTSWPIERRNADTLAVDLGAPGASRQALVTAGAGDTLALSLALIDPLAPVPTSAVTQRAAARLLMRVAGAVRAVRAVARAGDPTSLRFEVVDIDPATTDLARAFGALASAADLSAAEVAALLHDEAVARLYLHHRPDAAVPRAA